MKLPLTRGQVTDALLGYSRDATLFPATDGALYASLPQGAFGLRIVPLAGPLFRQWLLSRFLGEFSAVPTAAALRDTLRVLEAEARYSCFGPQRLERRLGVFGPPTCPDKLVLDLGDNHVVEITPRGWTLSHNPRYAFHPAPPLPPPSSQPHCGDSVWHTLQLSLGLSPLNAAACQAWLTASLQPSGPFPLLHITGPPASGKATLARLLGSVLHRPGPAIVIGELPRALASQALSVQLEPLPAQRTQAALDAEFARLHPALLAALCDSASLALNHLEAAHQASYPRLAETSAWLQAAAGTALPPPAVLATPLERALARLLEHRDEWTGTATDLRNHLAPYLAPALPVPSQLGHQVRNQTVYPVQTYRAGGTGMRLLRITKPLVQTCDSAPAAPLSQAANSRPANHLPGHTTPPTPLSQTPRAALAAGAVALESTVLSDHCENQENRNEKSMASYGTLSFAYGRGVGRRPSQASGAGRHSFQFGNFVPTRSQSALRDLSESRRATLPARPPGPRGMSSSPRIVSLIASATEIVHALGLGPFQVGRSHECDFPHSVHSLPVCTRPSFSVDGSSAEIDALVKDRLSSAVSIYNVFSDVLESLRPTHVITQTQCKVCAVSLEDVERDLPSSLAGNPLLVALQPNALAGIWDDIEKVASACGVESAGRALVADLQSRIAAISARAQTAAARPRVACIEWFQPLMAAGNWVPELVSIAHAENLFGAAGLHSPWMTWDQLQASDPDVIVAMPCGFDLARARAESYWLTGNPLWPTLRAVQNGQVYLADGNQYMNRPGPRIVESLLALAEILHPGRFQPTLQGLAWVRLDSSL